MINFSNNQFSCGFDIGIGKRTGATQIVDLTKVTPNEYPNVSGQQNVNSRYFIFKRFKNDEE